jgi:hypothetical protein
VRAARRSPAKRFRLAHALARQEADKGQRRERAQDAQRGSKLVRDIKQCVVRGSKAIAARSHQIRYHRAQQHIVGTPCETADGQMGQQQRPGPPVNPQRLLDEKQRHCPFCRVGGAERPHGATG